MWKCEMRDNVRCMPVEMAASCVSWNVESKMMKLLFIALFGFISADKAVRPVSNCVYMKIVW